MSRPASVPLRALVIGAGVISEAHLKYLAGSARAELVGVCDLSQAMADVAVERFGPALASTDYARSLSQLRPDVVHVLTPPATHDRIVRECLAAGCHVIVEKPIATDHAGFLSLWRAAQAAERRLIENHNYRFNEPVLAMERLVQEGTLGDVMEVEVRLQLRITGGGRFADTNLVHESHALPCGAIHEFITHLVYLTLRFLPKGAPEQDRIRAAWNNHSGLGLFRYDDLDATLLRGDRHARIRFSARNAPDAFRVTVRGNRGTASSDLFLPQLQVEMPRPGGAQLTPLVNQLSLGAGALAGAARNFLNKVKQKGPLEGLAVFLDRTYQSLAEGGEPPVTFEDMDQTMRLIEALLAKDNQL